MLVPVRLNVERDNRNYTFRECTAPNTDKKLLSPDETNYVPCYRSIIPCISKRSILRALRSRPNCRTRSCRNLVRCILQHLGSVLVVKITNRTRETRRRHSLRVYRTHGVPKMDSRLVVKLRPLSSLGTPYIWHRLIFFLQKRNTISSKLCTMRLATPRDSTRGPGYGSRATSAS